METAMAMVFDDSEWILADSIIPEGIDADWVITDGDEGSVSGVFYHPSAAGSRRICLSYASFGRLSPALPDPSLSFLPPAAHARSSSRGLLLLRGPWSAYYVCNPATAESRRIPLPPRPHHYNPAPPLALVVRPDDPAQFHIVCAIDAGSSGYRFEIFSSVSGAWKASPVAASTDPIVPGSGVSAAGVAYWRTSAPAVIAYDPEAEEARVLLPPPGCKEADGRWQLGAAGGSGTLCCTCVTRSAVVVYCLGPSDEWTALGSVPLAIIGGDEAVEWESGDPIPCRELPRPLRFESTNLEVVLWVDGRVLAVDLETRRVREIRFNGPAPCHDEDYVSYITTAPPVAPVASG
ncbi:hypothetical protein Cni_G00974 [Canna indica]|uniref:F-box protein At3g26010-like beta-propeller domain-containing protein n=1 Tax=Canna indica TaxID=4628 RepID=A0AAQ3JLX9_9LILI|nr:hypothetical protein Cni_G00974 [Canna indica]